MLETMKLYRWEGPDGEGPMGAYLWDLLDKVDWPNHTHPPIPRDWPFPGSTGWMAFCCACPGANAYRHWWRRKGSRAAAKLGLRLVCYIVPTTHVVMGRSKRQAFFRKGDEVGARVLYGPA